MEERALTCPNCGSIISNTKNCEYCGSLLVRFLGMDINLTETSDLDKSKILLPMIKALMQNLKMQKASQDIVVTDIYYQNEKKQYDCIVSVMRNGGVRFADGSLPPPSDSEQGLCIVIGFDDVVNDHNARKMHNQFKALDYYHLFDEHISIVQKVSRWTNSKSHEYYIDFGNDVEGAARLIADIITNVYGLSIERLEYHTNQGVENIKALRLNLGYSGRSLWKKFQIWQDNNPKTVIVIVVILFILNILIQSGYH